MIIHSPESPMPEPYKTYVAQRAAKISETLEPVVEDTNLQLCPRAITPTERHFNDGLVYGCVVPDSKNGLKSILYPNISEGIVTNDLRAAQLYALRAFARGEQVRVKDPSESDGDGQVTVGSIDELTAAVEGATTIGEHGFVVMPSLNEINDRFTFGHINLGSRGKFAYIGRELVTNHEGRQVFAGGDIAVVRLGVPGALHTACERLDIPSSTLTVADRALRHCRRMSLVMGRCSVDVLRGQTDSGRTFLDVVDVTPRVGGHTPAESLALAALSRNKAVHTVHASGRLHYNPSAKTRSLISGMRFVDTPTLVIAAEITDERGTKS